ncbi:hypothetical protein OH457_01815, partial [Vibrio sp. 2art]|uniref:hypothetical protein n=1 Tax=Vibrio sp. 2art TaxID=2998832 RepID=UPI0022CD8078
MARVDRKTAKKHAYFHLTTKGSSLFGKNIKKLEIQDGIEFYDVEYLEKDDPPLYVFSVTSDNHEIGRILISGTTYLGSTLISIISNHSKIKNTQEHRINLIEKLRKEFGISIKHAKNSSFKNIVYSYPRYGIGVKDKNNAWKIINWEGESFITDTLVDPELQGEYYWSFWDEFPQAGSNEEEWKKESEFISNLFSTEDYNISKLAESIKKIKPVKMTHILPVKSMGQKTNVHCAPCSLEMIYKYVYRKELSQEEVGEKMGILPMGTTTSGQVKGYKHYFSDDFKIELDRTPTWDELKDSIVNGLPVKSGIRGHARVAIGIRKDTYLNSLTGEIQYEDKLLLINDPEPVN